MRTVPLPPNGQTSRAELQDRLLRHLREVVRERDPYRAPDGHSAVMSYMKQELGRFGRLAVHEFLYAGRTRQNLILNLPGQQNRGFILVGAHYDAVPGSPGADDNGSALAVLLEMASAFFDKPARRPMRLAAFDLEEADRRGSVAYAQHLRDQREPLALMVALEMLGYRDSRPGSQQYPAGLHHFYPDRGDFIGLIGNLRTLPVLWELARVMRKSVPCEFLPVPSRGRIVPDTRRSDHASFWDRGNPAIMVTDTANMRNPHYHKVSDRIETLDIEFLAGVCSGLIAGLSAL
ncbi:M28 family peptidase (plasmid) [Microvirga sp. VF16]|nr:M28 family peptidase [Microvirga sp. VF16]QRM36117.1 M28 family peptidase [Microvirga sp. VF16]